MVDTYWGMILPQCAPAAMVYILYKFFQGIPRELEEAAFIDGAGRWRVFFTIVVPLSRPSLAAVGIFTFIASWNNFLWPYMVTNNPDLMTMPNGIATVMNSYGIQWAQLMAGGLMAGPPADRRLRLLPTPDSDGRRPHWPGRAVRAFMGAGLCPCAAPPHGREQPPRPAAANVPRTTHPERQR